MLAAKFNMASQKPESLKDGLMLAKDPWCKRHVGLSTLDETSEPAVLQPKTIIHRTQFPRCVFLCLQRIEAGNMVRLPKWTGRARMLAEAVCSTLHWPVPSG